ncbi:membrane protein, partial [Desmospora sp. 8437]
GVIILTMGVLAPVALGKIPWSQLVDTVKSYSGLAAVVVGILVAYLGGRGANLLTNQPTVVTGLMIGTIIGVALFRGVPVGPLIAAGILSLFTQFLRG